MGYYRPLFRRPFYRDWPVIAGAWAAFLAALALGVTTPGPVGLARPALVAVVVFPAASLLLAIVRQRLTRWR